MQLPSGVLELPLKDSSAQLRVRVGEGVSSPEVTRLPSGIFVVGTTTCYDLSKSEAHENASLQLDTESNVMWRVVGSISDPQRKKRIGVMLDHAVEHLEFQGSILIGSTDTTNKFDPSIQIATIPELGVELQERRVGTYCPKIVGTIPINHRSIVSDTSLTICSDSDLTVKMHKDLKTAFLAPGNGDNVWMHEADSVIEMVRLKLATRPNLVYHAIFSGGGKATHHEYKRTINELAKEFPGRVEVTLLDKTGGATGKLAKTRQPDMVRVCPLERSALTKELLHRSHAVSGIRGAPSVEAKVQRIALAGKLSSILSGATPIDMSDSGDRGRASESSTTADFPLSSLVVDVQEAARQIFSPQNPELYEARQKALSETLTKVQCEVSEPMDKTPYLRVPPTSYDQAARALYVVARDMVAQGRSIPAAICLSSPTQLKIGDVLHRGNSTLIVTDTPRSIKGEVAVSILSFEDGLITPEKLRFTNGAALEVFRGRIPAVFPGRTSHFVTQFGPDLEKSLAEVKPGDVFWQGKYWSLVLARENNGQVATLCGHEESDQRITANFGHIRSLISPGLERIKLEVREVIAEPTPNALRAMAYNEVSVERSLAVLDPTRAMPGGTFWSDTLGNRHIVVGGDTRQVLSWGPGGAAFRPTGSLIGENIQPEGVITDSLVGPVLYSSVPTTPAAWSSLQGGGLLRFLDVRGSGDEGRLVAHAEILAIEPAYDGDRQLDYTWRNVTLLLVDHLTGVVSIDRRNRHELELTIPAGDFPHATRVEAFSSTGLRADQVQDLQTGLIERSEEWHSKPIESVFDSILSGILRRATISTIAESTERINGFQAVLSAEGIDALQGRDPGFEGLLVRHKAVIDEVDIAVKLFRRWCGMVANRHSDGASALLSLTRQTSTMSPFEQLAFIKDAVKKLSEQQSAEIVSGGFMLEKKLERLLTLGANQYSGRDNDTFVVVAPLQRIDQESLNECEVIAKQQVKVLHPDATASDIAAAFKAGGGFLYSEFSKEYLENAIANGGILNLHFQMGRPGPFLSGFSLCYPKGKVPDKFIKLLALHDESRGFNRDDCGFYEVVCTSQFASPTTSLSLGRAAFIAMQQAGTRSVVALINEHNQPSMRSAIRDGYVPVGNIRVKLPSAVSGEVGYDVWESSVDPLERQELPTLNSAARKRMKAPWQQPLGSEEGFLKATSDDRAQFRAVWNQKQDSPFTRLSIGVTSMTPDSLHKLRELVKSGCFDGLEGVVTWGTTLVTFKRDDQFVVQETGGHHALMDIAARCSSDVTLVGIAPSNKNDPGFGKTVPVLLTDGSVREMPVVHIDNSDGTQVSVADTAHFSVIRPIVTEPPNYTGNIKVWHIEGLRSEEMGMMFPDSMTIFAAGGGVIRWEIEHLADSIARDTANPFKVVLLKGLGGSTDILAKDSGFIEKHRKIEAETGRHYLYVIDVDSEPEKVRELFERTGRITLPK